MDAIDACKCGSRKFYVREFRTTTLFITRVSDSEWHETDYAPLDIPYREIMCAKCGKRITKL